LIPELMQRRTLGIQFESTGRMVLTQCTMISTTNLAPTGLGRTRAKLMSTLEQVRDAGRRMKEAETALRTYTERPDTEPQNIPRHRHLADALKEATDNYVRLVSELGD
jgi:hypothetical protein